MVSPARPASTEGRSSWLAIAAIVLATLAFTAWLTLGGRSPGRVPGSLSEGAFLNLHAGQSGTFLPGRMDEGTLIACENGGLRVLAAVPARGKLASRHLFAPIGAGEVRLRIAHRSDDSVRIVCSR
jgi:hypothetical protein